MCREVLTDLNFKVNQDLGAVRKHSHCYVQKPQYCCFIVPSLQKEGNPPFHTHVCRLFLPGHLIPLSEVGLDLWQNSFAIKDLSALLYADCRGLGFFCTIVQLGIPSTDVCGLQAVDGIDKSWEKASPMPVKAHGWERDNCKLYILCFEMITPRLCLY